MKVELPSGETAELRDRLKAKDKFSVQSAVTVTMNANGQASSQVSGNTMTLMETALLSRLLESWSLDAPLPSAHSCPECMGNSALWHQHVADFIGDTMDLDDYNKLESIVAPLLEKVMATPNLETSSG
jgi:hypothetical protein